MYAYGILFTVFTGMIWTGVGICFSTVTRRKINFPEFMFVYALITSSISWLVFPDYNSFDTISSNDWLIISSSMLPYGLLGMTGFLAVRTAMERGSHAVVWALAQCAVVIPFIFAVIFWGDRPGLIGWLGAITLLLGITATAFFQKHTPGNSHGNWLIIALFAFLLIGASQVFSMLPKHLGLTPSADSLRIPVMTSAGLIWIFPVLYRRGRINKELTGFAAMYAALVLIGQFGLFKALDYMSTEKCSALVFPLAIGVCIVMFSLYSGIVLREKYGVGMILGISAVTIGIILMSLK